MKRFGLLICLVILLSACSNVEWDYSEELGPEAWGDLSGDYALCQEGESQSPINIASANAKQSSSTLSLNYTESDFELVDSGHSLEFEVKGNAPELSYNGNDYALEQIHFHNESENTINGEHYPLEAHFVNHQVDNEDSLLVLSVMFELGEENEVLSDKFEQLNSSSTFNPRDLIPESQTYYEFIGSLTTPPCTEGVKWVVFDTPLSLSEEQLESFTNYYQDNNRPVQKINERNVNHVN